MFGEFIYEPRGWIRVRQGPGSLVSQSFSPGFRLHLTLLQLAAQDGQLGGIHQAGVGASSTVYRVVALHPVLGVERVVATDPLQGVRSAPTDDVVGAAQPVEGVVGLRAF